MCIKIQLILLLHQNYVQIGDTRIHSTRLVVAKWAQDPYKMGCKLLSDFFFTRGTNNVHVFLQIQEAKTPAHLRTLTKLGISWVSIVLTYSSTLL